MCVCLFKSKENIIKGLLLTLLPCVVKDKGKGRRTEQLGAGNTGWKGTDKEPGFCKYIQPPSLKNKTEFGKARVIRNGVVKRD